VTNFSKLFQGATNLTSDVTLDDWDVSAATDMQAMFAGSSFSGSLETWKVGQCTDFSYFMAGATQFVGDKLGAWDTSHAQNFQQAFWGAFNFVGPENIGDWNMSRVTSVQGMFLDAKSFNRNVNAWDLGQARETNSLFEGASKFQQAVCWQTHGMNPYAKCFQCFCHTAPGAGFDLNGQTCGQRIHPSILAYSQACDADDLLEEHEAETLFAQRPEWSEEVSMEGASGYEAYDAPLSDRSDDDQLGSNSGTIGIGGSTNGGGDEDLGIDAISREVSGAHSIISSVFTILALSAAAAFGIHL